MWSGSIQSAFAVLRGAALAVSALVAAGLLFLGGVSFGKDRSAQALRQRDTALMRAAMDLRDAQSSLASAGRALRRVASLGRQQLAQATQEKRAADAAAVVAASALHSAQAQRALAEQRLAQARLQPDCEQLAKLSFRKVCGL